MNTFLIARTKKDKKIIAISDCKTEMEHILSLIEDAGFSSSDCEVAELPLCIGLIISMGMCRMSLDTNADLENANSHQSWEPLPALSSQEAQIANYQAEDIF